MNRRQFIVGTVAAIAAVTLEKLPGLATLPAGMGKAVAALTDATLEQQPSGMAMMHAAFDAEREYGRIIYLFHIKGPLPQEVVDAAVALSTVDARESLPPHTPFEIRRKLPNDYGTSHGVAWYYAPSMRSDTPKPLGFITAGGYFNHGRFMT